MSPISTASVVLLLSIFVTGCAAGYRPENGHMVFSEMTENGRINHGIRETISGSFSQLGDHEYAKDDEHVFYRGSAITGAPPRSFRYLGDLFSKDEAHVYWCDRVIEGADPATFKILDGKNLWAKDGHDVYFADRHLSVQDVRTFVLIKDGWGKDDRAFYYAGSFNPRIGVVPCHHESMAILDEYYAKDLQNVFYEGEQVPGADPVSFRVTGPWSGADKSRTYRFGEPNSEGRVKHQPSHNPG